MLKQYIKSENDIYDLRSPTKEQIDESIKHIKQRIEYNSETNYCLLIVAIGHSVLKDGSMNLALN